MSVKKRVGTFGALAAAMAAAVGAYIAVIRPWFLRWGALDGELRRILPGDAIVARPKVWSTRAITINASPAHIWPWLVQLGQGRGGLYSYDWLENRAGLDFHSADRILPEFQELALNDQIWLVPRDSSVPLYFVVAVLEPEKALVLKSPGDWFSTLSAGFPFATWAFVLDEQADGSTRLIARFRSDYRPDLPGTLSNQTFLEPIHFIMEQKMLRSIKERAERTAAEYGAPGIGAAGIAAAAS